MSCDAPVYCESCGDCLICYGEDPCPHASDGVHAEGVLEDGADEEGEEKREMSSHADWKFETRPTETRPRVVAAFEFYSERARHPTQVLDDGSWWEWNGRRWCQTIPTMTDQNMVPLEAAEENVDV